MCNASKYDMGVWSHWMEWGAIGLDYPWLPIHDDCLLKHADRIGTPSKMVYSPIYCNYIQDIQHK